MEWNLDCLVIEVCMYTRPEGSREVNLERLTDSPFDGVPTSDFSSRAGLLLCAYYRPLQTLSIYCWAGSRKIHTEALPSP